MKDFYQDLIEYTGYTPRQVKVRCNYASSELSFIFPEYENVMDFYRETDLYIYALTKYQERLQDFNLFDWLKGAIHHYEWETLLDYGGGIGEISIVACKEGVRVDYLDIENSKTWEYAKWRFDKYNVNPKMLKEGTPVEKEYDVIVAMDVLEHLENPQEVIEQIKESTDWLVCNPEFVQYNNMYPEHISKFDLSPYFEKVSNYLYKRKI